MAKSWQYPRWRRYLMQVVMWMILAATLGLAAVVTHYRTRSFVVPLSTAQSRDGVRVALPHDWQEQRREPYTLFSLAEPEDQLQTFRHLRIRRMPIEPDTPLVDVLLAQAELVAPRVRQLEEITIAGQQGLFMTATFSYDPRLDRLGIFGKFIAAAAPLPDGQAMVVMLTGVHTIDRSDIDLVKRIAASIEIEQMPATRPSTVPAPATTQAADPQ